VNANDATLTSLATAQTGSTVPDTAPNAPASPGFDLVLQAAAGSALGGCGAPYALTLSAIDLTTVTQPWPPRTLHQAFDESHGWTLSGAGPDHQCTQAFPIPVPGNGPGGPLADHTSLVAELRAEGVRTGRACHALGLLRLGRAAPRHRGRSARPS
jgi:hypothetical protein